jgi:iron uptake system component EfeO
MKLFYFLMITAVVCSLALSGCGKTDEQTTAVSTSPANETVDPQKGLIQMMALTDALKAAIAAKEAGKIKAAGPQLEQMWSTFEDALKVKFPDGYLKVENNLSPLVSGVKQSALDEALLSKLNDELHATLAQLSMDWSSDSKKAVDADALKQSKELQTAAALYITYINDQGNELVAQLDKLNHSISSGDLAAAQVLYVQSRIPYERIEPIIEKFSDLDGAMDARVDDYANENDPEFTGYHRIEDFLFVKKTTEGAKSYADELLTNGKKMRDAIKTVALEPADFITGVGELMEEAQTKKITGEEERWSDASLPVLRANVEGAQKIFTLVRTELNKRDPELEQKIADSLQKLLTQMDLLSPPGSKWTNYSTLPQLQIVDLKNKLEAVAEPMVRMPAVLGG